MSQKVVARFRDGRVEKGTSMDVDSTRPVFHLRRRDGETVAVRLEHLKALFYVRSLDGNAQRHERRIADPGDARSRGSTLVTVVFEDGEVATGMMIRYPPIDPFFFMVPVDPDSNNVRILVNRSAVAVMERVEADAGG
jgi:hypothetical protein